jgi:hypothetical protein
MKIPSEKLAITFFESVLLASFFDEYRRRTPEENAGGNESLSMSAADCGPESWFPSLVNSLPTALEGPNLI